MGLRNFNIDPERIYGSGFSGGSRIISWMLAQGLKEWTGTVHFAGFDALAESVPYVGKPGFVHYGQVPVPGALNYLRDHVRAFLIQGADDKVNDSVPSVLSWGEQERLQMKGLLIPNWAHKVPPDAGPIREAIDFIEAGVPETAEPELPDLVVRGIEMLEQTSVSDRATARVQAANAWQRFPVVRTHPRFLKVLETLEQW